MKETSLEHTPTGRERMLAAFAYLPPLCIVPFISGDASDFSRRHGRHAALLLAGLIVFAACVAAVEILVGRLLGRLVLVGWYFGILAWVVRYPLALCIVLLYVGLSVSGALAAAAGRPWSAPVIPFASPRRGQRGSPRHSSDNRHYVK